MKFCYSLILFAFITANVAGQSKALVLQTDFGTKDGAVAAMKGVAFGVSPEIKIFDLTHEIPAFNIWEGAYRLNQTAQYWPKGTAFVSVVDPGVGSSRKSIVVKTKTGHFIVTPDNGTVTLIAESLGIDQVREIDESKNRLKNSYDSYTFHGRDVYAYTGARLAAGVIKFEEVGKPLEGDIVRLPYKKPVFENGIITGIIDALDVQYGNVWTNIDQVTFKKLGIDYGQKVRIQIIHLNEVKFDEAVLFGKTFSDVKEGDPVAYVNSLLHFSVGINMDNFAERHNIKSGGDWIITLRR
ncbi:SAM hydrolase/SAM-dependent halogenase family protein [Chryseosolibacter indicus]|uniref:S-adenosyl-l-methionine hydroxide adenosyltransferase family protein n=1 Tax=Chryseosolibacter indicus TaxID=2782351 RepID=A0ABS5VVA5_9BACT|nr:S-adenosyl-l-methionine hydroxide adenosyltransferase family protein [Chryseosolibacter indicus]MBT1705375.1 S-adenosyl-l-methionine hydroxide adenosyltransferase family protein [Chryseosolibacter indicus]